MLKMEHTSKKVEDESMPRSKKKSKKFAGISRIDSKHTHGWYVRVYANGGVFVSKLFSDRLYGSKKIALDNAMKFRDHNQMVAELHRKNYKSLKRKPFYKAAPKNNTSGIVGVNEVKTKIRGRDVHYFQATWSESGKPRSKKFYVMSEREPQEAFQLAVELRKSKEKELYDNWLKEKEAHERKEESAGKK
ncbi:MAG: hypothetical protein AB7T22_05325 [Calditrichaceae bacterium]